MTFVHFKHLLAGPLHHTTISLVQLAQWNMMTFLHLKHLCIGPFHHTFKKNVLKNPSK